MLSHRREFYIWSPALLMLLILVFVMFNHWAVVPASSGVMACFSILSIWFKNLFEFSLSSFHRRFPRSSLLLTSNELRWLKSTIKQGDAATSWSQNVIMASTSSQSGSLWVSRQPGVRWPSTMNITAAWKVCKGAKVFPIWGNFCFAFKALQCNYMSHQISKLQHNKIKQNWLYIIIFTLYLESNLIP